MFEHIFFGMNAEWERLTIDELHALMYRNEADEARRVQQYGGILGKALQKATEAQEQQRRLPGSELHQIVAEKRGGEFLETAVLVGVAVRENPLGIARVIQAAIEYGQSLGLPQEEPSHPPQISRRAREGGE